MYVSASNSGVTIATIKGHHIQHAGQLAAKVYLKHLMRFTIGGANIKGYRLQWNFRLKCLRWLSIMWKFWEENGKSQVSLPPVWIFPWGTTPLIICNFFLVFVTIHLSSASTTCTADSIPYTFKGHLIQDK